MKLITTYFPKLTKDQINKLYQMYDLYHHWNSKINLISRKSFDNFYRNHVLHSLSIAKFIYFHNNTKIADIGTGGGFPGIPLAIVFNQCIFTLIDSKKKKIKVLKQIVKNLELKNIQFLCKRMEKINEKFDFIIGRAVHKNIIILYNMIKKNIIINSSKNTINNGFIYLKGNDIDINKYPNHIIKKDILKYFNIKFFKNKIIVYIPI